MKATKQTTPAHDAAPQNEKEAAYRFAVTRDSGRSIVEWMLEKHDDFADKVSDETREQLYEGFATRFHENQGENVYIKGDTGALILAGNTVKATAQNGKVLPRVTTIPAGAVAYGIHHVQAYTPQERGMLKSKDPVLHEILSKIATAFNKYASNTLGDMQRAAAKILAERRGQTQTRQTLEFIQSLDKMFDAMEKRVKNAEKRKDATADAVRFKMARDAFIKTYNAK